MSQSYKQNQQKFDNEYSDDNKSTHSRESVLQARISIYINDESIQKEHYKSIVQDLCKNFGEIQTIHIPKESKKGNLIFVEFSNEKSAENAIESINSDKELKMLAGHARPSKTVGQQGNSRQQQSQGQRQQQQSQGPRQQQSQGQRQEQNQGQRQQYGRNNTASNNNGNFSREQQPNNYRNDHSEVSSTQSTDGIISWRKPAQNQEQTQFQQLSSYSFGNPNPQQHSNMSISRRNDHQDRFNSGPNRNNDTEDRFNRGQKDNQQHRNQYTFDRKDNQQQRNQQGPVRRDNPQQHNNQGTYRKDNQQRNTQQNMNQQNNRQNQNRPNGNNQNDAHANRNARMNQQAVDALIPTSGKCNLCKRFAELKCGRCGEFYCSHECQRVDWLRHKPNCFPMPTLLPASAPVTPSPEIIKSLDVKSPEKENENDQKESTVGILQKITDEFSWNFKIKQTTQRDRKIIFCDKYPKSGDIVIITWPCSSNRVYLIQATGEMGTEYGKIMDWARESDNHGPQLEQRPDKGEMVFAKYQNEWFRALVQKVIDAEHVLVAFIDFGNAEEVHYTKLRQYLVDDDVTRYTYSVFLKDCPYDPANPMPEKVRDYLHTFSNEYTQLRIRYSGDWSRETNVELFVVDTEACVNDKVCSLMNTNRTDVRQERFMNGGGYGMMKKAKQEKLGFIFDDLTCTSIATESRSQVVFWCVTDIELNTFWCSLEITKACIHKMNDEVNAFAADQSNLVVSKMPAPNDLVIVKNHENWERAVIVSTTEDEARVMSIDYGGFYVVQKNMIFEMVQKLTGPVVTHMCRINGLPDYIEGGLKEYLINELEVGSSMIVDKISYDKHNDCHVLHMSRFIREIESKNLLKEDLDENDEN